MHEIIEIKTLPNHSVWLKFKDGFEKTLSLRSLLGKGMAMELLDESKFNSAMIEPGGGIAWPNGFDICPNYLREM